MKIFLMVYLYYLQLQIIYENINFVILVVIVIRTYLSENDVIKV